MSTQVLDWSQGAHHVSSRVLKQDYEVEISEILSSEASSTPRSLSIQDNLNLSATHLISSPYPDFANQLQLDTLDHQSRLFAFALTALQPIRENYATAPYLDSFNWSEVFSLLRDLVQQSSSETTEARWHRQEFYVVIFRSKLLADIDRDRLGQLDQMSHQEACASGGLLKYWFGEPDSERRNLATCLWVNREDAYDGGRGPWHKLARAAAKEMYERIDFHVHRLIIDDGADNWQLEAAH